MPKEYIITLSDEALPIVQKALDAQNIYQQNATLPLLNMTEYLQLTIDNAFAIHPDQIAASVKAAAIAPIVEKIQTLSLAGLTEVAKVVDAEAGKLP